MAAKRLQYKVPSEKSKSNYPLKLKVRKGLFSTFFDILRTWGCFGHKLIKKHKKTSAAILKFEIWEA